MEQDNPLIKVAVTGNTRLTLQGIKEIDKITNHKVIYVFGIESNKMKDKVNSVDMSGYCETKKITLDKSNDWDAFYNFCMSNGINKIITLGDSRIIPKKIVQNFDVIGNHGAILPDVQGGASLVWGRLVNTGQWGISIMKIGERVDSGDVLKTKSFLYKQISEQSFTQICDDLTIEALVEVLNGDYQIQENKKWLVRVAKHSDSHQATEILRYCLENKIPVYMPPRTPQDGIINKNWNKDFIEIFKIANNKPYPRWIEIED